MSDTPTNQIQFADFLAVDMRVGRVVSAEPFPEARKPAYKLLIDFGPLGQKRSSAQITTLYKPEDLIGKQVMAVVNFPPRQIANFFSEVLVLGAVAEDGVVTLMMPTHEVEAGTRIA